MEREHPMSPSEENPGNLPVFYRGLTEGQLLPYFQSQFPGHASGCGPFTIAIAANLYNSKYLSSKTQGAEVEAVLERKGLKMHGLGMPTWLGLYSLALRSFVQGRVEFKGHASIQDLQAAITDNHLAVVAISWQTTGEILRDLRHARVGHYMLAVGINIQKERLYFLNPGLSLKEGAAQLSCWTFQEFDKYWNATRNIFIRPGSMWTISQ
jgi:hypothetical protein